MMHGDSNIKKNTVLSSKLDINLYIRWKRIIALGKELNTLFCYNRSKMLLLTVNK